MAMAGSVGTVQVPAGSTQRFSQPRRRPSSPHPQHPSPVPAAATLFNSSTGAPVPTLPPHPKQPEHHVVAGSLSDRVPERAWGKFGNTIGSLLSRVLTTTATACAKATTTLLCLPGHRFGDRKASHNRYYQVQACCAKVQACESLEPISCLIRTVPLVTLRFLLLLH